MAKDNFEPCLSLVLQFEGGFSDNPADPGGATNKGVTQATLAAHRGHPVTKADVRALTRAEAADIYRTSYWRIMRCDELPRGVDAVLFDHAVNSGPTAATKALRRVLDQPGSGAMDAMLVARILREDPTALAQRLCAERLRWLQGLSTFATFGRGWTSRVTKLEAAALKMTHAPEPRAASTLRPNPSSTLKQQEKPMKFQGYRTFVVGLGLAIIPAALQYAGAVDWNTLIGPTGAFFVSGCISILMRTVTSTKPGVAATQAQGQAQGHGQR